MRLKSGRKVKKHLRKTSRLDFKRKRKTVSRLTVASFGLPLLLETSRILRNIQGTFKDGFNKTLRNIHVEGRKYYLIKKRLCDKSQYYHIATDN